MATIRIKRIGSIPDPYDSILETLADGEFGYVKDVNQLYIGRDGENVLINDSSGMEALISELKKDGVGRLEWDPDTLKLLVYDINGTEKTAKHLELTHTHKYAGSSTVGGAADSANKLNTNAGSSNTPVYFQNGVPVACGNNLNVNVTGNASTTTQLQNGRTIAINGEAVDSEGTTFNGTSNITLDIPTNLTGFSSIESDVFKGNLTGVADESKKLTVGNQGRTDLPVYFKDGVPVACNTTLGVSITGSAEKAKQLSTAHDIELKGDVVGSASFDGTSDAVITTTIADVTTSKHGLMIPTDKAKLDNTNVAYGTCETAADIATKAVTINGNSNWTLKVGSLITVKFTYTNTAASPQLNVNNTGAKPIYYNNAVYTSSSSYGGYAKRHITYQYDGANWVFISWSYDTNSDTKVQQNANIETAGEYPVMLGYDTSTAKVTNVLNKGKGFTYNPSTKVLTAGTFKGALDGNAKTATSATTASKLGTNAGDSTHPVYFTNGIPTQCGNTLNVNIDGNANKATQLANDTNFDINSTANDNGAVSFNGTENVNLNIPKVLNGFTSITSGSFIGDLTGKATSADKLNTNAGSSKLPIYFTNGVPTQCEDTLDVNISGVADKAGQLTNKQVFNINKTAAANPTGVEFDGTTGVNLVIPNTLTGFSSITSTTFVGNLSGKATSADKLNANAGSSKRPIYFVNGVPTQCEGTLDVSISGNANKATQLANDTDFAISGTANDNGAVSFNGTAGVTLNIPKVLKGFTSITAGSFIGDLTGKAASADKLNSNAGSSKLPTYFANGVPTQCGDTLDVNISKNASTATQLLNGQTFSISNQATEGGVSDTFDGTSGVALGLDSTLTGFVSIESDEFKGNLTGVATQADKLTANAGSNEKPVYFKDGVPIICDDTLNVSIKGKASSAEQWTKGITVSYTNDATGSVSFDGSENVSCNLTLKNSGVTAGTYGATHTASQTLDFGGSVKIPRITFDAKGRATGASSIQYTLPSIGATTVPENNVNISATNKKYSFTALSDLSFSDTENKVQADKKGYVLDLSGFALTSEVNALPKPMIFKGTLGTGGTITTLPSATSSLIGHTYRVIKDGKYNNIDCISGDVFVCADPQGKGTFEWIHIPSGNETHVQSSEFAKQWTTARDFTINKVADSNSDGTPIASSVDGNANVVLTIPEAMTGFTSIESTTFKGALDGNAKTATALTSNAGSSTTPIYFTDGKPKACGNSLNVSITGTSEKAKQLSASKNIILSGDATGSASFDGTADAKITVAIADATTDVRGLMSPEDKVKLNATNIAYGTCSTAADIAAKVVTIDNIHWTLQKGSLITVKFTYTNKATNATLNVNNSGAKPIYYNNAVYTSGSSYAGYANRNITYQYDGTNWVFISWSYDSNSDTKVNTTLNTTKKAYLLGTTTTPTASAQAVTTIADTGVYLGTTAGELVATTFKGALSGKATSAGTADKLGTNAGSNEKPVYFTNGIPTVCNDTLNVSIKGLAEKANQLNNEQDFSINSKATENPDPVAFDGTGGVALTLPNQLSGFALIESTDFKGHLEGKADTATTADKLGSNAGDSTHPIYFKDGVPKQCGGTLDVNINGTAAQLKTAQTIQLTGDVTGSATFDGTAAATIATTIADKYVLNSGDTVTGHLTFSNTSNQAGQPALKWKTIGSANPFIGYASDQSDGTFALMSIEGTNYASGLAIGGSSKNLLWKGVQVATVESNVNSATQLKESKTFTISDKAGEKQGVAFNGTENITLIVPKTMTGFSSISSTTFNGNATSASKLTTTTMGSSTVPVYFANGIPAQCGSSLDVSISGTANKAKQLTNGQNFSINSKAAADPNPVAFDGTGGVALTIPDTLTDFASITSTAFVGALTGNATSADKLNTNAGSTEKPVYFADGVPKACNSTLDVSIKGNANTTTQWKNARSFTVSDYVKVNTGNSTSVNGTADINLAMPENIQVSTVQINNNKTANTGVQMVFDSTEESLMFVFA